MFRIPNIVKNLGMSLVAAVALGLIALPALADLKAGYYMVQDAPTTECVPKSSMTASEIEVCRNRVSDSEATASHDYKALWELQGAMVQCDKNHNRKLSIKELQRPSCKNASQFVKIAIPVWKQHGIKSLTFKQFEASTVDTMREMLRTKKIAMWTLNKAVAVPDLVKKGFLVAGSTVKHL